MPPAFLGLIPGRSAPTFSFNTESGRLEVELGPGELVPGGRPLENLLGVRGVRLAR
jgi:hypothetical protein